MTGSHPPINKRPAPREWIQRRLGITLEEAVTAADRHTQAVQCWLPMRAPGAVRREMPGTTLVSSGLGAAILNQAVGARFPETLHADETHALIGEVRRFFGGRGVPWYWWVGPGCTPTDIGEKLSRHGLTGRPLPAMAAPLPAPAIAPEPSVRVWRAADLTDLEAASTIRRTAFRFPPGAAQHYFEQMPGDWLANDRARLFLAGMAGGPPAAIGALIIDEGMPGVYVMASLPGWQRRGLGGAILNRIMQEAGAEGFRLIALTASDRGYGLYRRFGFEHLFDYRICRPAAPAGDARAK